MANKKELYTKEQLKKFEAKANEFESEQELLVSLKAIRVYNGEIVVRQFEGLEGTADPVIGILFTNEFPYSLYTSLLEEIKKKDSRRRYAQKMSLEHQAKLSVEKEEF